MAQYGFRVGGPDGNGADLGELLVIKSPFQASLWITGTASNGQLGNSTNSGSYSVMVNPVGTINPSYVSAGGYRHTAAIKTDGTLWSCGYNVDGALGDNTSIAKSSPVQTIAGGKNWKQVSCGRQTAAIKTDGTLWTWGYNFFGQLGDSSRINRLSPVQTITGGTNWDQVACGRDHIAAIKTDGTLWTCGYNFYGQLGDGTVTHRSSPVQTIAGGTDWKQVSAGERHTAAIKIDGTLWLWGFNRYGGLGDSTNLTGRSSPVQTIAGGTDWKQVACGYLHTAAIKTDGTLWTWGWNTAGQLGDSTIVQKSSPVQTIAGGTNWKQVAGNGFSHTAAIKTDGTLWTWGNNGNGQLGDSTLINRSSPAQVTIGVYWGSVATSQFNTIGIAL